MNPYVHELRHLLRSRAMIALLAVTILGGAVAYPTVGGTFVNVSGNGFWYESGGSFHVDLWAEDGAGNPTHGVVVEIRVVEPPAFNGTGSSALVLDSTGVTNDQGEVTFQIPDHLAPSAQYLATLSATDPNPVFLVSGGALATTVSLVNQSTTLPQSLSTPFTTVAQGFYSAHLRLQVVWGGPGGGAPIGDRAVACDVPVNWSTGYYNAATNCTSATRITALGALTGYSTFLPLPPSPPPTGNRSTF